MVLGKQENVLHTVHITFSQAWDLQKLCLKAKTSSGFSYNVVYRAHVFLPKPDEHDSKEMNKQTKNQSMTYTHNWCKWLKYLGRHGAGVTNTALHIWSWGTPSTPASSASSLSTMKPNSSARFTFLLPPRWTASRNPQVTIGKRESKVNRKADTIQNRDN